MTQLFGSPGIRVSVGAAAAVLAMGLVTACEGDNKNSASSSRTSDATASASATQSSSESSTPRSRWTSTPDDTDTPEETETPEETATPEDTKTAYDRGECLSGSISTGGDQEQLDSVDCSDSSANFKVLRVYPYTTAGQPCEDVSGADYTYSSYWTRNGVPTYGSTYCLQEIA
jgi:hypothetical protein